MPIALITPEQMLDRAAPWAAMLEQAGFDVRYPRRVELARGMCSEAETIEELDRVEAVIAGGELFSSAVLAACPALRVIARAGVGYDRVDVSTATARRIALTITPTANHEAVAEHALALMLAIAKSVVIGDGWVRSGHWTRTTVQPLRGKALGIIGLGRIGRSLALRATAMGMKVTAFDALPDRNFAQAHGIALVELDALLAESDYLSLNCPLTDQTRGLIDKTALAQMKPGSVLINTSRGGLVVEADLIDALKSGHLRGAGLDVFTEEPPAKDNPLFELDNVVLTPHLAGTDEQSIHDMAVECAHCIIALFRGDWPDGAVVNHELKAEWKW